MAKFSVDEDGDVVLSVEYPLADLDPSEVRDAIDVLSFYAEKYRVEVQAASVVRTFGFEPRVALLASSTFGFPRSERSERIIEAVHILDGRQVDFEYDGEMAVDVALDKDKLALYPFARITDTANVLIMPAIHSASISTKLLEQLSDVSLLGPLLVGLDKSVQIAPLGAKMSEIYNAAVVAAYDVNR